MSNNEIVIRYGTASDAETLAPLAIKIFNHTFAGHPLNKPEDMKAYIADALSLEQIRRELSDKNTIVFIVEVDEQMVGFAELKEHSTENCIADQDPIEIQRFYIAHEYHGKGLAHALMQKCLEIAREKNYQTIWLGVWEHNHRALRFYEKLGFQITGNHIFQLGNDPQTDLVMERKVAEI